MKARLAFHPAIYREHFFSEASNVVQMVTRLHDHSKAMFYQMDIFYIKRNQEMLLCSGMLRHRSLSPLEGGNVAGKPEFHTY